MGIQADLKVVYGGVLVVEVGANVVPGVKLSNHCVVHVFLIVIPHERFILQCIRLIFIDIRS